MSFSTVEERVDNLEKSITLYVAESREWRREAAERSRAADARSHAADARMDRFEQEMREQRAEAAKHSREADARLALFQQEMRTSKRELDKKWGDLANKMGTIIEDILAPNLRRLAREHFQFAAIDDFMLRRSRRSRDRKSEAEFDTIVAGPEAIILGEAKSSPSIACAQDFAEKAAVFFDYFPEYQGKRLIPVFGSWAIPDPVVEKLTQLHIYAMRMGEDTMELVNAPALEAGEKQK